MEMATSTEPASQASPSGRRSFAGNITLGALIAITIVLFVMQGYRVSGACMEPHLYTGERVLAYKMAYLVHAPLRGDIVIFHYPRNPSEIFVKRVIGLPGETVEIRSGRVLINGNLLSDPHRAFAAHGNWGPEFVPHDHFFVMGDNRDVSDDSRYWGCLPSYQIVGRAVACYWPLRDCQLFH